MEDDFIKFSFLPKMESESGSDGVFDFSDSEDSQPKQKNKNKIIVKNQNNANESYHSDLDYYFQYIHFIYPFLSNNLWFL